MASPQLEDGYLKIANEIQDAFCQTKVSGAERQVIDCIVRKTYGWGKKEDRISISQLMDLTKLAKRTVIYAIKNLEAKNMITVKRFKENGAHNINIISLQKDHSMWVVQEIDGSARKDIKYRATIEKQKENYKNRVVQEIAPVVQEIAQGGVVQEMVKGSARVCTRVVQEFAHTKDTIQKTKQNTINGDFEIFWKNYPHKKDKQFALKTWNKIKKIRPDIEVILTAIKKEIEWRNSANGAWRPEWKNPSTWLSKGSWEDELKSIAPVQRPHVSFNPVNCKKCGKRILIKDDLTKLGCIYCPEEEIVNGT